MFSRKLQLGCNLFYRCKCPDIAVLCCILFMYILYIHVIHKNTLTLAVYMLCRHCTKCMNKLMKNVHKRCENLISCFVKTY
jgi:hypothetical protein